MAIHYSVYYRKPCESRLPSGLVQESKDENHHDGFSGSSNRTPSPSCVRMTDVDISLNSQRQSQPNRRRVEYLGHIFEHGFVSVSSLPSRNWFSISQGIDVKVPESSQCFFFDVSVVIDRLTRELGR